MIVVHNTIIIIDKNKIYLYVGTGKDNTKTYTSPQTFGPNLLAKNVSKNGTKITLSICLKQVRAVSQSHRRQALNSLFTTADLSSRLHFLFLNTNEHYS